MACALLTRASDSIAPRKPDDIYDKDSFIRGCLWTGDLYDILVTTLEWIISFRMSQAPTESEFLALDPLGITPVDSFCALLLTSRTRYSCFVPTISVDCESMWSILKEVDQSGTVTLIVPGLGRNLTAAEQDTASKCRNSIIFFRLTLRQLLACYIVHGSHQSLFHVLNIATQAITANNCPRHPLYSAFVVMFQHSLTIVSVTAIVHQLVPFLATEITYCQSAHLLQWYSSILISNSNIGSSTPLKLLAQEFAFVLNVLEQATIGPHKVDNFTFTKRPN